MGWFRQCESGYWVGADFHVCHGPGVRQCIEVAQKFAGACIVRPHTAAGTSKASGDAVSLAQHLQAADFDLSVAVPRWQTERLAVAEGLIHHGWRLARNSGLGQ